MNKDEVDKVQYMLYVLYMYIFATYMYNTLFIRTTQADYVVSSYVSTYPVSWNTPTTVTVTVDLRA